MSARASPRRALDLAALRRRHLYNRGGLAELERLLGCHGREHVHDARDDSGPAGLMARAEAGAIVAVEILIEEEVVAPVRILLELPGSAVNGAPSIVVLEEDASQPARNFLGHLVKSHATPGAGRTLDREFVAIVDVVLHQGPDD